MSMYESEVPAEPGAPPPGPPPAEPGAPPPVDVPEYGAPEDGTLSSTSWWDSMASLTLCGKKVTNEQAKAIFTALMAAIVLLVVVVIVMAAGGGGGGGSSDALVPEPSRSQSVGGGGSWQVQQTVGQSDWVRLSGKNAVCSAGGCTGRIEVLAPDPNGDPTTPVWGTVCGHWFWDNDEPANIVCRALGYASGQIYTFGTSRDARDLPTVLGFRECSGTETNLADCTLQTPKSDANGNPVRPVPSCYSDPTETIGCNSGCSHHLDQGAICYAAGQASNLQPYLQRCQGCGNGCGIVGEEGTRVDDSQTIFFNCIDYYTAQCQYDSTTNARGSYLRALNEFTACAETGGHTAGYCHGALTEAAVLSNQDVCQGGSNTNIAFHIRIPFLAEVEQTIHFRYHADFGAGSFIGVDGAEHTPGNLWGHVQVADVSVAVGDHEFEALGFEDCCDGHSELEIHLPCDAPADGWRVVKVGSQICMSCAWTGGDSYSAQVSVVVDNSHDTYCNGRLIGSGNSWNTPDTFSCSSKDGGYVIGIDGVDGEVGTFGYGALMASIKTNTGVSMNTVGVNPYVRGYGLTQAERSSGATPPLRTPAQIDQEARTLAAQGKPPWRCWKASFHGEPPPAGWEQVGFDDSGPEWQWAISYGQNDDPDTHWAQYIPLPAGSSGGRVKPGIADDAEWIWTEENDGQNDVFCRGIIEPPAGAASQGPASCSAATEAAAVCGSAGGAMQCGPAPSPSDPNTADYRLSDYPQGRIEVFKDGQWGTVCGHWFWDSNDGANIVCKKLGYAGGTVYTAGSIHPETDSNMPIHAGCNVCHPDDLDAGIMDCGAQGEAGSDDGPGFASTCGTESCAGRHDLDQGAICFTSEEFTEWGQHSDLVQPCGEANIEPGPNQALVFGCIQFTSVYCVYDSTNSDGSYDAALAEFATCENREQPEGYCKVSISSAQFLRNEDVCVQPATPASTNIGFHIQIPFECNYRGTYHFRMHADYGMGSHIGVDGAEHSPGNLWGHIMVGDVSLNIGDHMFEALGFEDCCDGHAELEIHLPCDFPDSTWRTVHSGSHTWMAQTCMDMPPDHCPAPDECAMTTDSAAVCGNAGQGVSCAAAVAAQTANPFHHGSARLSSEPQGRIEVYNENIGGWGTVCGHWFWDNHNVAKIVCQQLGYADGLLYTYGASPSLGPQLPIVAGFSVCQDEDVAGAVQGNGIYDCSRQGQNGRPDSECEASGIWTDAPTNTVCNAPQDRDCARGRSDCDNVSPGYCTHSIDQGAICLTSSDEGQLKCHTHNAVEDANCDDWHHCVDGCQTCGGCGFGCAAVDSQHTQDVIFGCVEYASVQCTTDVSGADAIGFSAALQEFASCAVNGETAGYCRGSLASAAFLRNQDVCAGPDGGPASNSNIAFHIRIPFRVNQMGSYIFRYHVDFGLGSFIGIDGPEHTSSNQWGHLNIPLQTLSAGDHEFESLGFEDCCDGHSELEIHLTCDSAGSNWRVVVSGETPCLECTVDDQGNPVVADECWIDTASAAQCGTVGGDAHCTGSQSVRLSSYPQGRIEVFNPNINAWGTVCGHWMWDNDGLANVACKHLGYDGGTLYTYGGDGRYGDSRDDGIEALPIVAGFRVCSREGTEDTVFDCPIGGDAGCVESNTQNAIAGENNCNFDCKATPPGQECRLTSGSTGSQCSHAIDQGAICYHAGDAGALACQTHNGVDDAACDDWHHCSGGCQTCSGCHFGCSMSDPTHDQDVLFGCVDYATAQCTYDVTNSDGSFERALRIFAQCAGVNPQPPGYCRGSLASAAFLANHDVCQSGSTSNIGFHVRMPFRVTVQGSYELRYHTDFGLGSFIGVDGPEHTTGNQWGHLMLPPMQLSVGAHNFESLGFEDCCDGHAEIEIHLTCDLAAASQQPWRVVVAGETDCLRCDHTPPRVDGTVEVGDVVPPAPLGADPGTSGLSVWDANPALASTIMDGSTTLTAADIDRTFEAYHSEIHEDGLFSDWDCLPFMAQMPFTAPATHPDEIMMFEEYNGGTWHGVRDHAVAISFAWDPSNLYLGVKVKDDTHQLNGNSGWDGDSVQVVFANNERTTITHLYNYAITQTGEHVAHHERGPGGTTVTIERDEAAQMTGYEVTFPAESFDRAPGSLQACGEPASAQCAENSMVAIGITVNDGDLEEGQGGQKGWSGWGPHSAVYGKTPSECGLVTLVAQSAANDLVPGCAPQQPPDTFPPPYNSHEAVQQRLDVTHCESCRNDPEPTRIADVCMVDTTSAAQCGMAGTATHCTGSQIARLSSYPQGRIEVCNPKVGDCSGSGDGSGWGTVCGHWLWDNDGLAKIVCKELGYDDGALYTYGASDSLHDLPIVAGYRVCSADGAERSVFECPIGGDANCNYSNDNGVVSEDSHCDFDCAADQCHGGLDDRCTHAIDQGAICFHSNPSNGQLKCHSHNGVAEQSCDQWHHCTGGCQACGGCHFGCSQVDDAHPQDVIFGCVDYMTTHCVMDVTNGDGSFNRALRVFTQCAAVNPQADGYCQGSLASAAFLSNQDVCINSDGVTAASNSDIGFHIRIPFRVNLLGGTYHFRMHADYGQGSFIGVDGAEHTTGDIWGHVLMNALQLTPGNHEFESLGFDACCDGHAELEVHLPCDTSIDPWRIVVAGEHDCMRCTPSDPANPIDIATCSSQTSSAGCCGEAGSQGGEDGANLNGGGCSQAASQCTSGDTYMGCFIDNSDREIDGEQYTVHPDQASLERCSQFCYARGFLYYAMQYGRECWCDNNYGSLGRAPEGSNPDATTTPAADSVSVDDGGAGCDMPCAGNPDQWCGGSWRNSVYLARGRGLTLTDDLVAKYTFDCMNADTCDDPARDDSGNGHHGTMVGVFAVVEGGGFQRSTGSGYHGKALALGRQIGGRVRGGAMLVNSFQNYNWGSEFSVSVWFNRGCITQDCSGGTAPYCDDSYSGIISNGYYTQASFEIRMGREDNCTSLGGGIITSANAQTWDHSGISASLGEWHHTAMVYDGTSLHFYLDGVQSTSRSDTGDLVVQPNDLVIGKAGEGQANEYFYGMIDDVQIWSRVLSTTEVLSLYHH